MKADSRVIVDVTNTHYDVVKQVIVEDMQWKIVTEDDEEEEDDFDIFWSDLPVS
jgi:hypothetical protein